MSLTMNHRASTTPALATQAARWLLLPLVIATAASACISDAEIDPCVRDHSCGAGGDPGGSPSVDSSELGGSLVASGGADDLAGAPSAGGATEPGDVVDGNPPCDGCAILPSELVAPCSGKPYRSTLNALGGVAPYSWQLTPAVAGWSIAAAPGEPSRAVLEAGAPAGETTLTIRAVDSRGLEASVEYRMLPRDACWFAYTAGGLDSPQLSLLDPYTEPALPAELEHNENVYDFQFSPNGHYLAYRYDADTEFPHGRHLALVELSTLEEQALEFLEDAVIVYAWSPDSSVLAVGFSTGGESFLGGVRLPGRGSIDSPLVLSAMQAFVEEELMWIGNDSVAYLAELLPDLDNPGEFLPNLDHLRTPFFARLGVAGFGAAQLTSDSFEPNVFLQPGEDGFWVINSLTTFFPGNGQPLSPVEHYGVTLVAPSGRYSAGLDSQTLQLFAANEGVFAPPLATSKPNEACPMPLAWSQQDRIACLADVANAPGLGSHGEVRFFDLNLGSDLLTMSTLGGFCHDDLAVSSTESCTALREGYGYGVSEATDAPRGFSASGRWFAFTRATGPSAYLYWADLEAKPAALSGSLFVGQTGSPARLAFSPDSRKIGVQLGERLFVKSLTGVSPEMLVTTQLATEQPCSEQLPTAPDRYCGNTALDSRFQWAPDSKALAYRASGSVTVVDTSHANDIVKFLLPEPVCVAPLCSGEFAFQPPLQP